MKKKTKITFLFVVLGIIVIALIGYRYWYSKEALSALKHQPDVALIKQTEKNVSVIPTPEFPYSYALMQEGVIQHLDRNYTYDVIPDALEGGVLFQGIHRPPKGTSLKIQANEAIEVYFFFHYKVDGGYSEIFPNLDGWKKLNIAPQYDIHNGDHGLKMIMYKKVLKKGSYVIPPTTKDKACFSIVFKNR